MRFVFITTEHQQTRGTGWGLQCALLWKIITLLQKSFINIFNLQNLSVKLNILMFSMFSLLFSKWCADRPGLSFTVLQALDSISHQPRNRPQFEGETSSHIYKYATYTSVVNMVSCTQGTPEYLQGRLSSFPELCELNAKLQSFHRDSSHLLRLSVRCHFRAQICVDILTILILK